MSEPSARPDQEPRLLRVLLIDDDEDEFVILRKQLGARQGYVLEWAPTAEDGISRLREKRHDACLLDYRLGPSTGLDVLRNPAAQTSRAPILLLTGAGDVQIDDAAMHAGAADYLDKNSVSPGLLDRAIRRAIERKALELTIRDREQFMSIMLASITDLVVATDAHGRIAVFNTIAEQLTGVAAARAIGEPLESVLRLSDEETGARLERLTPSTQKGMRPMPLAAVLEFDGERRFLSGMVYPIRSDAAHDGGVVLVLRDVTRDRALATERHALEARARAGDRLAAIGTLAAGVAHEVNNPLSFVMINLELLGEQLADRPELAGMAREALDGVKRIRDIVATLRIFSRSEGGSGLVGVDLRDIVDSALRLAQNDLQSRARIVTRLEPPPVVRGDPTQLTQVAVNLLINAAHAIQLGDAQGQEIGVATGALPDGRAFLEVWDTGAGIDAKSLPHVFEPFFATRPSGIGTGLGLSISHGIVSFHGGELTVVESAPGKGTRFRVALPSAPHLQVRRAQQ